MTERGVATWTITIDRPPAAVFDYLADVTKHAEWSPKPYRVEGVSGPVRAGDRFTSYGAVPGDKDHRNEVEVVEVTRPTRLVLDAIERGEHFVSTFELRPSGGGTVLTRTMDAPKPRGLLALVFPLVAAVFIRPDVQKGLRNLKANLEKG